MTQQLLKQPLHHLSVAVGLTATIALSSLWTPPAMALPLVGFPDATPTLDVVDAANSGAFITVTRGLSSLGDTGVGQNPVNVTVAVPASLDTFALHIFDGDLSGLWDTLPLGTADAIEFKLFSDPTLIANTDPADLLYSWPASTMPDDDWCVLIPDDTDPDFPCDPSATVKLPRTAAACPNFPLGNCYYHLVADWIPPVPGDPSSLNTDEQNAFKVAVEGQPFLPAGSTVGFEVLGCDNDLLQPTVTDCAALVNSVGQNPQIGLTEYNGILSLDFLVPAPADQITLFDGDADLLADDDDANSPACEPFIAPPTRDLNCVTVVPDTALFANTSCLSEAPGDCIQSPSSPGVAGLVLYPPFQIAPDTLAQGVNEGAPEDDTDILLFRKEPPVRYDVTTPLGEVVSNENPSGDKEWEQFIARVATPGPDFPVADLPEADATVTALPAGLYNWRFEGLDYQNTLFLYTLYDLFAGGGECGLSITKACETPTDPVPSTNCLASPGDPVTYRYAVSNSSNEAVLVSVVDNQLGIVAEDATIGNGDTANYSAVLDEIIAETQNVATVTGVVGSLTCTNNAIASVRLLGGSGQGCTPGYWKQPHHFGSWEPTGYAPEDYFAEVFDAGYTPNGDADVTLLDAVKAGGGGYKAFGRHAVAALLNAANPNVDYLLTVSEVISRVRAAYESGQFEVYKDLFEEQNEQGCPLGRGQDDRDNEDDKTESKGKGKGKGKG